MPKEHSLENCPTRYEVFVFRVCCKITFDRKHKVDKSKAVKKVKQQANSPLNQSNFMHALSVISREENVDPENTLVRTDVLQGATQALQQQHANNGTASMGHTLVNSPTLLALPPPMPTPQKRPAEESVEEKPPKPARSMVILDLTREDVEEEVKLLKNQLADLQEKYDRLVAMQIALTELEIKKTRRTVVEETVVTKAGSMNVTSLINN